MATWGRREYGKLFEAWPRTPSGDTEEPVYLTHCGPLDFEAEALQSMLEAFDIPSIRCLPGDGAFGEVILGVSGNGVDIFVPKSMLETAQELMKGDPDDEIGEDDLA